METRRMLFVAWGANLGGISSSTHARMKGLASLGVESEMLFRRRGAGMATFADFPLHIAAGRAGFASVVRAGGYDAISFINSLYFRRALARTRYRGTVVFELRGMARGGLRACARLATGRVQGIIVPSEYVRALVERALRGKPIPVRVVPSAVDTSLFCPGPASHPGRPVLLWVGRLDANKNWPEMLRIVRLLVDRGREVEAWVVGDTNVAGDVRGFRRLVGLLRLTGRVHLRPCVPYREMPGLYRQVAGSGGCVLSTSRSEGLQNSLLEGMACGCPVIGSAVGGNRELVDGSNGDLYPPGEPAAAADAVERLLENPSLRRRLAENGLARIDRRHTPRRHARAFLEALAGLPGPPRQVRRRRRRG